MIDNRRITMDNGPRLMTDDWISMEEKEKKASAELEQKSFVQKGQLEEARGQVRDQQRLLHQQDAHNKRLESDLSLLRGECQRIELNRFPDIYRRISCFYSLDAFLGAVIHLSVLIMKLLVAIN